MAYDEYLDDRIRRILHERRIPFIDKKMMGGLCFMINDKMCFGIIHNELMARIGPEEYQKATKISGVKEMNFTGRPMIGYVFIEPETIDLEEDLEYWIQLCLNFNPFAKASKKRK